MIEKRDRTEKDEVKKYRKEQKNYIKKGCNRKELKII